MFELAPVALGTCPNSLLAASFNDPKIPSSRRGDGNSSEYFGMRVKCLISYEEISVRISIYPYTKMRSGCQLGAEYRYYQASFNVPFPTKS